MICNLDYYDPTNDQYILKEIALKTESSNKKLSENDIIRIMLNDFNTQPKITETFQNNNNNKCFIILFILFILFCKFIM